VSDDLAWLPGSVEAPLLDAVHRVVGAVMRLGGAVGWVDVPDLAETAGWLAGIAGEVKAGRTRMALLELYGRVAALGRWTRYAKDTVAVNAEVLQVMVHPDARGRGLAALLTHRVATRIQADGDTPILHVAEGNDGARRVYERLGFAFRTQVEFVAVTYEEQP